MGQLFLFFFKLLLYEKAFNDNSEDALSAFEVLCMETILALREPTVNEFADATRMSSPNATYRINRLIEKGFIKKKRGKTERREFYLETTEKYSEVYGVIYDYIDLICERIKTHFPQEDVETFDKILGVVANELTYEADSFQGVAVRNGNLKEK